MGLACGVFFITATLLGLFRNKTHHLSCLEKIGALPGQGSLLPTVLRLLFSSRMLLKFPSADIGQRHGRIIIPLYFMIMLMDFIGFIKE
jgi:hypothetical protein